MVEILRNLVRHKVRTSLTIFGIVIGIFALTVMGSMSEYFNNLVEGALKYAGSTIGVSTDTQAGGAPLSASTLRRLKRLRGVQEVIPEVIDPLEELGSVQMGTPELVFGVPPELAQLEFGTVQLRQGRWLQRGDTYHAVVGFQVAKKRDLKLGDTIEWRKEHFTVVGLLANTNSVPDQFVIVPLDIARRTMKRPDAIMSLSVVPEDAAQIEALAELINEEVDGVRARSPQEAINQAKQGLIVFNLIMLSGAFLAVVVGGLAVINTMLMSVTERTREIGVKKAVGADDLDIVMEYVTEAAAIGFLGGIMGLGLGSVTTRFLNHAATEALGGTEIFTLTPRLAITSVIFAMLLGAIGGLYPAWRASRLDPVQALRSE